MTDGDRTDRRQDLAELDQHCGKIVLAAEGVLRPRFEPNARFTKPEKTQLANLVGVCSEATCAEEIANYLRYQAGRGQWELALAEKVIETVDGILKEVPNRDEVRVEVWKLFATYFTRAYVYLRAKSTGAPPPKRS